MKLKKKICNSCETEQYIWKNHQGNKYCQHCWNKIKYDNDPPKPKIYTAIKPKSKKQIALDNAYSKLRKIFLTQNPMCQAHLSGCQGGATDVHHKRGRGKWLLVITTWMAVCRTCHSYIHLHPTEARELGFLD